MGTNKQSTQKKKQLFSYDALRIIGISLSILSLGFAIAVIGYILTT